MKSNIREHLLSRDNHHFCNVKANGLRIGLADKILYNDQQFDLWPCDLKINRKRLKLLASTVPSSETFEQRGQRNWADRHHMSTDRATEKCKTMCFLFSKVKYMSILRIYKMNEIVLQMVMKSINKIGIIQFSRAINYHNHDLDGEHI